MRIKDKSIFELSFKNIILAIGIVCCTALSIVASLLLGRFIDFLSNRPAFDHETLVYLIAILCALVLTVIANVVLAQFLPLKFQLKKSIEYSQGVMRGLLNMSQRNYLHNEKGYYINLVTSSAFTCGDIYGQLNIELIGNLLCVLVLIIIATFISPFFGLAYIFYIPFFAILTQRPNKKIAAFQKEGLPTQDAFLSGTKKIVEDKRAINVARAEEYYEALYDKRSIMYLSFVTKYKWYSLLSTNVPLLLSAFLTAATIGVAAKLYFDGKATIGTVFLVFQLSQLLQGPLNRCFEILIYRSINSIHIERISEFNKHQYEPSGFEDKYHEQDNLAVISSAKVFSSPDKERLLFSVDKLILPKNKLIVIKGGNGTGKSTLTNLLTGFSDIGVFEGHIEIDKTLSNASYLSHPILFADGTVEENLFGRKIDPELLGVLDISFQNKTINESGSNLSYGEQQKLALLRVLSSDATVVVLDEPFTNLDYECIRRLSDYIVELKKKKSVIAIMHSPELDQFADIILKIDNKRLVYIANMAI